MKDRTKMGRRWLAIVAIIALSAGLAACGGDSTATTTSSTTTTTTTTAITGSAS